MLFLPLHPNAYIKSSTVLSALFLAAAITTLLICVLVNNIPYTRLMVLFTVVLLLALHFTPIPAYLCIDILVPGFVFLSLVKGLGKLFDLLGRSMYWLERTILLVIVDWVVRHTEKLLDIEQERGMSDSACVHATRLFMSKKGVDNRTLKSWARIVLWFFVLMGRAPGGQRLGVWFFWKVWGIVKKPGNGLWSRLLRKREWNWPWRVERNERRYSGHFGGGID
jgi:hypothetical protein